MSTRVVKIGLIALSAAATTIPVFAQQRVNEIAPGRGQEILKMQTVPQVILPPEPKDHYPRPYPFEPVYPWVGYYHRGYHNYCYPYNNYNNNGYYQPVIVQPIQVQQAQPIQPPRELTELEYAMDAMQAGKTSVAIDRFLEHLKSNADDFVAMRLIGLMYLEEKQPSEAAARIAHAYKRMPELARRPLDAADLQLDSGRLREMVVKASRYANRMKTGSGWLMVTVLMQAEGRIEFALANLAKAEAAGLDVQTVSNLRATLAPMEVDQIPVTEPLTSPDEKSVPENGQPENPKNP